MEGRRSSSPISTTRTCLPRRAAATAAAAATAVFPAPPLPEKIRRRLSKRLGTNARALHFVNQLIDHLRRGRVAGHLRVRHLRVDGDVLHQLVLAIRRHFERALGTRVRAYQLVSHLCLLGVYFALTRLMTNMNVPAQ